ncbi:MAG: hypothetical protein MHM6MM_005688 [Cercozoa sp. M6MM]
MASDGEKLKNEVVRAQVRINENRGTVFSLARRCARTFLRVEEALIFDALLLNFEEREDVTAEKIAEKCALNEKQVRRCLQFLYKLGFVQGRKSGKLKMQYCVCLDGLINMLQYRHMQLNERAPTKTAEEKATTAAYVCTNQRCLHASVQPFQVFDLFRLRQPEGLRCDRCAREVIPQQQDMDDSDPQVRLCRQYNQEARSLIQDIQTGREALLELRQAEHDKHAAEQRLQQYLAGRSEDGTYDARNTASVVAGATLGKHQQQLHRQQQQAVQAQLELDTFTFDVKRRRLQSHDVEPKYETLKYDPTKPEPKYEAMQETKLEPTEVKPPAHLFGLPEDDLAGEGDDSDDDFIVD